LLVIGECKGLRPRSGLSSIAKREPGHQLVELTDQPRCAALPIRSVARVDRAARAHCSSVRPPVAGMRPGPRAPHPATAPTPVPALLDRADQLGDPFFPFDFNHNPANKMQIAYSGPWIPDFPVPYN
jgi:hypothetical protein